MRLDGRTKHKDLLQILTSQRSNNMRSSARPSREHVKLPVYSHQLQSRSFFAETDFLSEAIMVDHYAERNPPYLRPSEAGDPST